MTQVEKIRSRDRICLLTVKKMSFPRKRVQFGITICIRILFLIHGKTLLLMWQNVPSASIRDALVTDPNLRESVLTKRKCSELHSFNMTKCVVIGYGPGFF